MIALAFLLFALPAQYAHGLQWSLERVVSVGEAQGVSFGAVSDIAPAADRSFYVLDRMESRVLAFSGDGRLRNSFGQRGAGPGELSSTATSLRLLGGQLVVVDRGNARINLFETDGSFLRSRPLNRTQGLPMGWTVAGGRLVVLMRPLPPQMAAFFGGITQHSVFSYDVLSDAEPDTLIRIDQANETVLNTGGTIRANLDAVELRFTGDNDGRLLLARTDTYSIRIMDRNGRTTGMLSRQVGRHRYTRQERELMRVKADSSLTSAMKAGAAAGARRAGGTAPPPPMPPIELLMPEYAPALKSMLAGERFVLVTPGWADEDTRPALDVFDYSGRYLGTLTLPARFTPHAMSGDLIYGVEKDEYDVDSVVVYRMRQRR